MSLIDQKVEQATRSVANRSSRRGFLGRTVALLLGTVALPLLPISRAQAAGDGRFHGGQPDPTVVEGINDPTACNYWRHCALDGFACSCCGGSQDTCPPGTELSSVTWIGTCHNPEEGKDYVISYNDCCGHGPCLKCHCANMQGERPIYRLPKNNDVLWCFGTKNTNYQCTLARIVGTAGEVSDSA